jgi:hypothetical protein
MPVGEARGLEDDCSWTCEVATGEPEGYLESDVGEADNSEREPEKEEAGEPMPKSLLELG